MGRPNHTVSGSQVGGCSSLVRVSSLATEGGLDWPQDRVGINWSLTGLVGISPLQLCGLSHFTFLVLFP